MRYIKDVFISGVKDTEVKKPEKTNSRKTGIIKSIK